MSKARLILCIYLLQIVTCSIVLFLLRPPTSVGSWWKKHTFVLFFTFLYVLLVCLLSTDTLCMAYYIQKHFFIFLNLTWNRSQSLGLIMYVQIEIYSLWQFSMKPFTFLQYFWIYLIENDIRISWNSKWYIMRNCELLQQWSAYHFWHLTYCHLLEKLFHMPQVGLWNFKKYRWC